MLKLSVISLYALDTTLKIRGSPSCTAQAPRFSQADIFNDLYCEARQAAALYLCVREQMLSVCFQEMCNIST